VKRNSFAACLTGALVLAAQSSLAQRSRPRAPPASSAPAPPKVEARAVAAPREVEPNSLQARLGISVSERLLRSDDTGDRQRAFERLGSVGTTRALELLLRALEPGGAARGPRERLIAVRALSPHARTADVRRGLVRVMGGLGAESAAARSDPLDVLVRESAALALAASGTREASEALSKALWQEGPLAETAARAVVAHPPDHILPLLRARGAPTEVLARTLGRLGDQRAFYTLRDFVKRGSPAVRAEAALALTLLGELETVQLARHWLKTERDDGLRVAAARILTLARAPDALSAMLGLLARPETREAGLELALASPSRALAAEFARELGRAPEAELPQLMAAISRAGGPEAARILASELGSPGRNALAAQALALAPGPEASDALERALNAPATRRLGARAAVVRALALDELVSGSERALENLLSSADPADRAAGAWGLAVLDGGRAARLVASRDAVVVRASARACFSGNAARAAAARLSVETDPETRAALAIALADRQGADAVATSRLLELLEGGGIAAPLAARALAAREDDALRPRIEALLESNDAVLRAHAALGLADSAHASAVGLLERAYRFESQPEVRHAIVAALSQRSERAKNRVLELAARLDSDADTREAARLALGGGVLGRPLSGPGSVWLSLVPNPNAGPSAASARPVLIGIPGGPALPAVADPDGLLVLAGLPRGSVTLRLAPSPVRGNAR